MNLFLVELQREYHFVLCLLPEPPCIFWQLWGVLILSLTVLVMNFSTLLLTFALPIIHYKINHTPRQAFYYVFILLFSKYLFYCHFALFGLYTHP